jgi:hypothetical protein
MEKRRHLQQMPLGKQYPHVEDCFDAIKTTLRFHLTPVRRAIINGNNNNKCWQGCGETGTFMHCW